MVPRPGWLCSHLLHHASQLPNGLFPPCVQLKSFHNELLTQLEQKVELDSRYLSVSTPCAIPAGPPVPGSTSACTSVPWA